LSRRSMPFVCANAGTMPASITTAARIPTPLQNLVFRCIRFFFGSNRWLNPPSFCFAEGGAGSVSGPLHVSSAQGHASLRDPAAFRI
jgi:hypothetical protein